MKIPLLFYPYCFNPIISYICWLAQLWFSTMSLELWKITAEPPPWLDLTSELLKNHSWWTMEYPVPCIPSPFLKPTSWCVVHWTWSPFCSKSYSRLQLPFFIKLSPVLRLFSYLFPFIAFLSCILRFQSMCVSCVYSSIYTHPCCLFACFVIKISLSVHWISQQRVISNLVFWSRCL